MYPNSIIVHTPTEKDYWLLMKHLMREGGWVWYQPAGKPCGGRYDINCEKDTCVRLVPNTKILNHASVDHYKESGHEIISVAEYFGSNVNLNQKLIQAIKKCLVPKIS